MRSLFYTVLITSAASIAPMALAANDSQKSSPAEALNTTAAQAEAASPKIKYKAGKDLNFDELLIQGELKRPELSVVTGNVQPGSDGLLRLRENFTDRITIDVGEELP